MIRHDESDLVNRLVFNLRHLAVASRHHYDGVRVLLRDFANHVLGFALSRLSHGARVDDIDVGNLIELGDRETALLKIVEDTLSFILVYFAPKSGERCCRQMFCLFNLLEKFSFNILP